MKDPGLSPGVFEFSVMDAGAMPVPPDLPDKQHFAVSRQRPEVVGNHRFELVAERAELLHLRDHVRLDDLGVGIRVAVRVMVVVPNG